MLYNKKTPYVKRKGRISAVPPLFMLWYAPKHLKSVNGDEAESPTIS